MWPFWTAVCQETEEDRQCEREEQEDHRAGHDDRIRRRASNRDNRREPHEQNRQYGSRPDGVHRRTPLRTDLCEYPRNTRDTTVTRERVQHARDRGHCGQTAEELRHEDDAVKWIADAFGHALTHAPEEHVPALLCRIIHVGKHQNECAQHEVTEQARPDNRRNLTLGHRHRRILGFFRSMGRGIVAGDGIDRQKQSNEECHPHRECHGPNSTRAFSSRVVLEREEARKIVAWRVVETNQRQGDCTEKDYVSCQVRQFCRQADAKVVEQRLQGCDDRYKADTRGESIFEAERRAEGTKKEVPSANVDGAKNCDETQEIKPRGKPARETVAENRTPVIQAASGRISGRDFRKRQGKHERHQNSNRPADTDGRAADARRRLSERIDTTRQNTNN